MIIEVNSCTIRPHVDNVEHVLLITLVEYSRDQLLMKRDNVAHFMSVDYEISTPICQQLVDLVIDIERLKTEPIWRRRDSTNEIINR